MEACGLKYVFGIKGSPCADPEGWGNMGSGPPLKYHKNKGVHSNTGPDPMKNHKATNPKVSVAHQHVSETPFHRRADNG